MGRKADWHKIGGPQIMPLHEKVVEAFVAHWKRQGHTKKEIYGNEEVDEWGIPTRGSLLADLHFLGHKHGGGSAVNYQVFKKKAESSETPIKEEIAKVYRIYDMK